MKRGFTLAEVLITLGLIGVVAALTIPNLLNNINNRVLEKQIKVFNKKLFEGMSLLNVNKGIGPYYGEDKNGTRLFVGELSKYLKIIKVCDKTDIKDCIGYDFVTKSNGSKKNVSEYFTDNGSGVGMSDTNEHKFGEVLSIVLADGTPFVFTYDLACPVADPSSRILQPTVCIHGWFDANGNREPNTWGKDIVAFNYGWGRVFYPKALTASECRAIKDKYGIKSCLYDGDTWAGAVQECGGVANMPNMAELIGLTLEAYKVNGVSVVVDYSNSIRINRTTHPGLTFDSNSNAAKAYGLAAGNPIYSGDEVNYVSAAGIYLNNGGQHQLFSSNLDRRYGFGAICRGD